MIIYNYIHISIKTSLLSIYSIYKHHIYIYHISIKTGSWLTHPVDPSPPRKASVPPLPTVAMLFSPAAEGQGGATGWGSDGVYNARLYIYI